MGDGTYSYAVDPESGVLDPRSDDNHLPKGVTEALTASGAGKATITVTGVTGLARVEAEAGDTSTNWSGYALASGPYTSATGNWVVPDVSATTYTARSSSWVGVDGWGNDDLIQTGTASDFYTYQSSGACTAIGPCYFAWWEILPADTTVIDQPVQPGDRMTGEVTKGNDNVWTITLVNHTQNWTFTIQKSYTGPLESAEWIEEATEIDNTNRPLANYGSVTFLNGTLNGQNPALSSGNSITLERRGSSISTPSEPDAGGSGFSVAYGSVAPAPPSEPG
jgi:hypothetical protein